MALGLRYLEAVEQAGGIPVVLPPLRPPAIAALLAGSAASSSPAAPISTRGLRGASGHALLGPTEPRPRRLRGRNRPPGRRPGIPILGICRGAQTLNIARGGTLHQHLPDVTDGSVHHRQTSSGERTSHDVTIAPGSLLARRRRGRQARRQLLPPSGDRPARPGPARRRLGPDGTIEGDRGPVAAIRARRPVARRDARRPPPRARPLQRPRARRRVLRPSRADRSPRQESCPSSGARPPPPGLDPVKPCPDGLIGTRAAGVSRGRSASTRRSCCSIPARPRRRPRRRLLATRTPPAGAANLANAQAP